MRSEILGTVLPAVRFELSPGEAIIAEPGEFSWMSSGVTLNTTHKPSGRSSWTNALGRMLAGGGLFMTEYRAATGGEIAFAAKIPGHIVPVQVQPGRTLFIHKHGFLCAEPEVELGMGFQQSIGSGLFGGDGFILQKLQGAGTAWVELGGEIVKRELAAGEELLVHPGHVGMFDDTIQFDIQMVSGIRNFFFGANGIFMARLRGPGRVMLQTLTMPGLAGALAPYLGAATPVADQNSVATLGAAGGVAGILGSLFGGRE